jgi:hypothetical protein
MGRKKFGEVWGKRCGGRLNPLNDREIQALVPIESILARIVVHGADNLTQLTQAWVAIHPSWHGNPPRLQARLIISGLCRKTRMHPLAPIKGKPTVDVTGKAPDI